MGKGSGRRPGDGYEANHAQIFGERPKRAPYVPPCDHGTHYLKPSAEGAEVLCTECNAPCTPIAQWPPA